MIDSSYEDGLWCCLSLYEVMTESSCDYVGLWLSLIEEYEVMIDSSYVDGLWHLHASRKRPCKKTLFRVPHVIFFYLKLLTHLALQTYQHHSTCMYVVANKIILLFWINKKIKSRPSFPVFFSHLHLYLLIFFTSVLTPSPQKWNLTRFCPSLAQVIIRAKILSRDSNKLLI
jgi:hypothetical protein